jgi:pimeloyl-ACP methyl ester carboxylesterase
MLNTESADGTDVRAYDEGRGPVIVMLHPGLDDGTRLKGLAARLTDSYRVVRLHRRQYRLDLKPRPTSIAQEVEDVVAVGRAVGGSALLYGHSDGGVVALEALAAAPDVFAAGVVFEPAAVIDPAQPLAGEDGQVVKRARELLAAGKPGRAMEIFSRDTVGMPGWQAKLTGTFVSMSPRHRALAPAQIDSVEALDALGVRLDTYAGITVPTVLLRGDRGPAGIHRRLDAIAEVMPQVRKIIMPGRDHGADLKKPDEVATVIREHAVRCGLAP